MEDWVMGLSHRPPREFKWTVIQRLEAGIPVAKVARALDAYASGDSPNF
jgi:hypothetical protein